MIHSDIAYWNGILDTVVENINQGKNVIISLAVTADIKEIRHL